MIDSYGNVSSVYSGNIALYYYLLFHVPWYLGLTDDKRSKFTKLRKVFLERFGSFIDHHQAERIYTELNPEAFNKLLCH